MSAPKSVNFVENYLNDRVRNFADAPDPGDDINCRCWAEVITNEQARVMTSLPPDEPGLVAVYPEAILLPALRTGAVISAAARAARAKITRDMIRRALRRNAQSPRKPERDTRWRLGDHKSEKEWENRYQRGGWTDEKITDTIKNGEAFPAPNKVKQQNTATRYEKDGNFVVRDDQTNEIIQVGKPNFVRNQIN